MIGSRHWGQFDLRIKPVLSLATTKMIGAQSCSWLPQSRKPTPELSQCRGKQCTPPKKRLSPDDIILVPKHQIVGIQEGNIPPPFFLKQG